MKDKSMERVSVLAENHLLAFKYSGFWISDRVSASKFWQLRVSGREVAQGRLHPHDGHPLLLLLWPAPGDRGPLGQDQPPALCPLRGHHVHQVMLTIRVVGTFYRNDCLLRYLELHGLNTVGIFRVGSNKKRVDKVGCLWCSCLTFFNLCSFSSGKTLTAAWMWSWLKRWASMTWPPSSRSSSGSCLSPCSPARSTSPCWPSRVSDSSDYWPKWLSEAAANYWDCLWLPNIYSSLSLGQVCPKLGQETLFTPLTAQRPSAAWGARGCIGALSR